MRIPIERQNYKEGSKRNSGSENTISELKNLSDELNTRFNKAKEEIGKLDGRTIEMNQICQKEKRLKLIESKPLVSHHQTNQYRHYRNPI